MRYSLADIAEVAGFFGLSNRMAQVAGMRPKPELHLLGRVPRYWRVPRERPATGRTATEEANAR